MAGCAVNGRSGGFSETEVPHLFKSSGCYCDEGPYGWGDERPLVESCGWSAAERYAATYKRKTWDWAGHEDLQALLEGLDAARAAAMTTPFVRSSMRTSWWKMCWRTWR